LQRLRLEQDGRKHIRGLSASSSRSVLVALATSWLA
jgi:hypothetical protein